MINIEENEIINASNIIYDTGSNSSTESMLSSISSDDEIVVIQKKVIINYINKIVY